MQSQKCLLHLSFSAFVPMEGRCSANMLKMQTAHLSKFKQKDFEGFLPVTPNVTQSLSSLLLSRHGATSFIQRKNPRKGKG